MSVLSDEELVIKCKAELPHRTRSFELLVERHMNSVYRIAYRVVQNSEEAEDIAQETFLKAYNALPRFDQKAAFSSWLYRIALNTALDALDKSKRRPQSAAPLKVTTTGGGYGGRSGEQDTINLLDLQPSKLPGPEESIIQVELRQCINQVLKSLEQEQASVLLMRDFDAISYDEIAKSVGASLSAVKMRIHRARLAFQKLFSETCGKLHLTSSLSTTKTSPSTQKRN